MHKFPAAGLVLLAACGASCGGSSSMMSDMMGGDSAVMPPSVWTMPASGTTNDLLAIAPGSTGGGLAVGLADTILSSTNGTTWTLSHSGAFGSGADWAGVWQSGTSAIIVGDISGKGGVVAGSSDGGKTWSDLHAGTNLPALVAVWGNGMVRIVVGAGGTILVSSDGGKTFAKAASATGADLDTVWGAGTTVYAGGSGGALVSSSNSGGKWQVVASMTNNSVDAIWGVTPVELYMVVTGGVSRAVNGTMWMPTAALGGGRYQGAWGGKSNQLFVVGSDGTWRTGDGGDTWINELGADSPSGVTFRGLAVTGSGDGSVIAVGRGGAIARRPSTL